jgi:hypothetical protein
VKLRTEAPVNGGRNYNGPKVRFASLSKIWLFAGKSEYPTLRGSQICVKMRLGADNQQERPVGGNGSGARSARFVEGHDFSRAVTAAK